MLARKTIGSAFTAKSADGYEILRVRPSEKKPYRSSKLRKEVILPDAEDEISDYKESTAVSVSTPFTASDKKSVEDTCDYDKISPASAATTTSTQVSKAADDDLYTDFESMTSGYAMDRVKHMQRSHSHYSVPSVQCDYIGAKDSSLSASHAAVTQADRSTNTTPLSGYSMSDPDSASIGSALEAERATPDQFNQQVCVSRHSIHTIISAACACIVTPQACPVKTAIAMVSRTLPPPPPATEAHIHKPKPFDRLGHLDNENALSPSRAKSPLPPLQHLLAATRPLSPFTRQGSPHMYTESPEPKQRQLRFAAAGSGASSPFRPSL